MLETSIGAKLPVPIGKWSDTRGMAFVASVYGLGILEMINEKSVAFGPTDMEVTTSTSGFTLEDGVWFSNMGWKPIGHYGNYRGNDITDNRPMCKHSTCTSRLRDDTGYCVTHTQKKPVVLGPTGQPVTTATTGQNTADDDDVTDLDLMVETERLKKASGEVDVTEIPFDLLQDMYARKEVSKKQYKKGRRHYEEQLREGKIKPFSRNLLLVRHPVH